jgi:hypothetical protein
VKRLPPNILKQINFSAKNFNPILPPKTNEQITYSKKYLSRSNNSGIQGLRKSILFHRILISI